MTPTNKQPLFIITGASCVGKTTMCEQLFRNEKEYIVMESDLLWHDVYNMPENGYNEYHKLWMNVCAHISQSGLPVVLCGCAVPKQFEELEERKLFSEIYYLSVVCDNETLHHRMRVGRNVTDETWIKSSTGFNHWLKENADKTEPKITLIDTTNLTAQEAARIADSWIMDRL